MTSCSRAARALALALSLTAPCLAQEPAEDIDARTKDYLMRHGDAGVIDPNLLLRRIREFQQQIRPAGPRINAIGGSNWVSLGPSNGAGRILTIAPHPTVPGTLLVGAAGGGVWKSTDSGATWSALSETIPNLAASALAIAPSNPNIIYLGTGEAGPNGDRIPGVGLLASSDGGNTWTLPASVLATAIVRISVHPTNPQELVVATNSGLWRSTGGLNGPWTEVIPGTKQGGFGAMSDVIRDPSNAQVLYAATWGGAGADCTVVPCQTLGLAPPTVMKSTNGGVSWTPAASGLPTLIPGTSVPSRISLAIAPSSPQTLYASLAVVPLRGGQGVWHVYKTTNGAASWSDTSLPNNPGVNRAIVGLGQYDYDNTIGVSPSNANVVLVGGVGYGKTTDGGQTWTFPGFDPQAVHADAHDIRYDAAATMYIANDGGIWSSTDDAAHATERTTGLVTQQFYTAANHPVKRSRVMGGVQDIGIRIRPEAGGSTWDHIGGGDGIDALFSSSVPMAFITFPNAIRRSVSADLAEPTFRTVTPLFSGGETSGFFTRIVADPQDPAVFYTGSNRLWKSSDGGETWIPLPAALSGGTSPNTQIHSIAIARSQPQTIMVAFTNSAIVNRTTNGGTTWTSTTVPTNGRALTNVLIDPRDPNRAWVTVAGMTGPSVYRSTNGGATWTATANGLPSFSAQVIRADPTDSTTLYAGTDVGVYRSTDSGDSWTRFGSGMPAVAVDDLQMLDDGSVLRAATHGRGIWELTVTGVSNSQPQVAISTPASPLRIVRGTSMSFSGTFSDGDAGDSASGTWIFPDNWSQTSASSGQPVTHTFNRAGRFPVTLRAIDCSGAIGAASVDVLVADNGDSCDAPLVIPPNGPWPWSVTINTEGATSQASDPAAISACTQAPRQTTTWLSFTPAATGTYNFSFCGSRVSAVMAGYSGASCGPYQFASVCLSNVQQQQESATIDCANALKTSATLAVGTTVRFLVSNLSPGDFGPVTLSVSQSSLGPIVTSLSPATGSAAGGTAIVITGSGFTSGMSLQIGGAPATGLTVLTPNVATAVTPKGTPGPAIVTATFPNASPVTLANAFTYEEAQTLSRRRVAPH